MTRRKKRDKRISKSNRKHKPGVRASRSVIFHNSVLQSIRQHARRSPDAEICGALIGTQSQTVTTVTGAVAGEGASQGKAHVTFTQEAWVRIHKEKDRKYSGQSIVGWYHSHPGFGVFLSDHDLFIHKNFFTDPGSLAWVYDPHSDEEGCFGWNAGEVRRLDGYNVAFDSVKDALPRKEPAITMPAQDTSQPRPFEARLSSRRHRLLLVLGLATFLILLVALGALVFQRGGFIEHARDWLRQRQNKRAGESVMPSPGAHDQAHAPAEAPSTGSDAESIPTTELDNDANRDGEPNEQ